MGKWMEALKKIQNPTHKAPAKPAKPMKSSEKGVFAGFAGALYQGSTDFYGPSKTADKLRQAVQQARDWQNLSAALERAQAAFEQGQVTRDQAEELAILAAQTAHKLPKEAHQTEESGTVDIPAEDLLVRPSDAANNCLACGQSTWWDNAGQQTCGVCHPVPEYSRTPDLLPKRAAPVPPITRRTPGPPVPVTTPVLQLETREEPDPLAKTCIRCGSSSWWYDGQDCWYCDKCLADEEGHGGYAEEDTPWPKAEKREG